MKHEIVIMIDIYFKRANKHKLVILFVIAIIYCITMLIKSCNADYDKAMNDCLKIHSFDTCFYTLNH